MSGWTEYPYSKYTTLKVSEAIQQLRDDNELLTALRIYDRLDSEKHTKNYCSCDKQQSTATWTNVRAQLG